MKTPPLSNLKVSPKGFIHFKTGTNILYVIGISHGQFAWGSIIADEIQ